MLKAGGSRVRHMEKDVFASRVWKCTRDLENLGETQGEDDNGNCYFDLILLLSCQTCLPPFTPFYGSQAEGALEKLVASFGVSGPLWANPVWLGTYPQGG